jgi:hypothetical protein
MASNSAYRIWEASTRRVQDVTRYLNGNKAGQDATNAAKVTAKGVGASSHRLEASAKAVNWKELGDKAGEIITENPKAFLVPTCLVGGAAAGAILMMPALGVVGLSSIGPVAGMKSLSLSPPS